MEIELKITGDEIEFTAPITMYEAGEIIGYIARMQEKKRKDTERQRVNEHS